ncbi:hypothetical protein DSO57_1004656 [Entomophthora muscae]|uniref:Uncharacterized protein n=1 Tax=Entomophthora muscae TaxID=34485 RepID=A0ACC2T7U0_9FUNG|nr:hypothetical protein DSO57_1004656 [Entomophthora muscae]
MTLPTPTRAPSSGASSSTSSQVSPPFSQSHRPNPQPRYLRDPTTLESISSAFTGISSYVRKSIPEALLPKGFPLKPNSQSPSTSPSSSSPPPPA